MLKNSLMTPQNEETTTRWKTRTKRVVLINSERFFERLNLIITVCFTWYLMRWTRHSGESTTSGYLNCPAHLSIGGQQCRSHEGACKSCGAVAKEEPQIGLTMSIVKCDFLLLLSLSFCLYYHHISLTWETVTIPEYMSIPQIISQSKKNSLLSEKYMYIFSFLLHSPCVSQALALILFCCFSSSLSHEWFFSSPNG